jgi:hypothetical protein
METVVMGQYPNDVPAEHKWQEPIEKREEFQALAGLSAEEKSALRVDSVWREIDSSGVDRDRRHLLTIKSGTATINDTQVGGMFVAIRDNHEAWLRTSRERFGVSGIDIVIGLTTYGTDSAINNKENQILNKLTTVGFEEVDREHQPGVLANHDGAEIVASRSRQLGARVIRPPTRRGRRMARRRWGRWGRRRTLRGRRSRRVAAGRERHPDAQWCRISGRGRRD